MHRYFSHVAFLVAAMCIVFGLGGREWHLRADGHLHLRFLDVGQGDSALITTPTGKIVVIDGGPDWSTLESLGRFLPFFSRHIDLLIVSHPNLDHLLSFPEILKRYSVGMIAFTGVENPLPRYQEILALAREKNIPLLLVSAGKTIDLGDGARLEILWPPATMPKKFPRSDNDTSIVAMLSFQNHRALFTGDEERPVEETLVRAHADVKADVLKVPHHGSRTSSSTGFLLAVSPKLAIISVGANNSYGHPRQEVIDRLRKLGAEVRRTDREGTIEVVW